MRGEQEAEPGESIPVIKAENDESEQKLFFVKKNDPYEEGRYSRDVTVLINH